MNALVRLARMGTGLLFLLLLVLPARSQSKKNKQPETTIEQVAEKCKGLSYDKRVVVKVARFSVSAKSAQAQSSFGEELATMLTSAIQQTNCFRVVETNKNVSDATGEMAFGQDGFSNGSGPQAGKMLGAQLVVTGEITDFSEGNSSSSFMGVSSSKNQASVGFTLKLLNPQTGEILFAKDVNSTGSSSSSSVRIFGVETKGSTQSRAVQDATQRSIIRAVEIMAEAKDNIPIPEPMKPIVFKKYTASNCQMLKAGSPKMMILVTEATTAGTARTEDNTDLARREREMQIREREASIENTNAIIKGIFGGKRQREADAAAAKEAASRQTSATAMIKPVVIEQTATETELTRRFSEAGFRVIDPKVYGKMKKLMDSTGTDLGSMAALGLKMGADIIVTGQTISERTNSQGGMTACRARLEIRVIATEDGTILATNTVSGGGIDVSEAIANKQAIANATDNMTQYLLERLCSMNVAFANSAKGSGGRAVAAAAGPSLNTTEIEIKNTSYAKIAALAVLIGKNPKVKFVKKSVKGTEGLISVEHSGSSDELIDALSKHPTAKFEVTNLEEGKVNLAMN